MSQTVDAIYENGAFRPVGPVLLPERKRVRLTIEASEEVVDREAARAAMIAGFDKMKLQIGSKFPSRDELHERD
jgi:predicted DNA-binding antitoxin AbrB/MazE fold protein